MEETTKKRRMRKVSSWMSDAAKSIENEEEIIAGKLIVLKVLRYMETNHMSQKELAAKLGVSPQYINKFLHGQDCDIKISTAIRYGRILNLKLVEIPDDITRKTTAPTIIYSFNSIVVEANTSQQFIYNNRVSAQSFKCNWP